MVRQYLKDYYQKHKEEIKARSLTVYNFMREQVAKLLGEKCVICNRRFKRIVTHEIYGKKHPYGGTRALKYILEHPDDFRRLCSFCHDAVHRLANYPEIAELAKYIERKK